MRKKAIAAGHICIDITPVFPDHDGEIRPLGEILRPGRLLNVNAPDIHTGGSVANTGLAMKQMGADVRLVGKIGTDSFGSMIRRILDQYDAGSGLIAVEGETTSYSVVIAVPGVDRVFLHCPGANDTFDGSEITDRVLEDAVLFHFGYPPIMKKMYEDGGDNLSRLFQRIHHMGIATSLDMAAVDPLSEAGKADWTTILGKVLPYVDFFVPSFEELCYMLDLPRFEKLHEKAGDRDICEFLSPDEDIVPLAEKCLDMGAKAVLLKCGVPGIYLQASGSMEKVGKRLELDARKWNDFRHFENSYKVEHVLSGTGAGDASIAAFLCSLLEGDPPGEAVRNAAAAGALCCMSYDAVSGLKPLADIRRMIDRGWEKYN